MTRYGNRIPFEFFVTKGTGESDNGSEFLPYETGSYDAALTMAGIQNANVIEYTSVMPPQAKQISSEEGIRRIQWGEVLEVIKASANGKKGDRLSAAVIVTAVHDPKGRYLGGFACEYAGSMDKSRVEASLLRSVEGMIERRGYGAVNGMKMGVNVTNLGYKIHPGIIFEYAAMDVKRKHGSVLVALCFVSHKFPRASQTKKKECKKRSRVGKLELLR